jgi:Cu-processing system permease protein
MLLSVALSLLGLGGLGNFGVAGFGRTAASLLNLILFIVPLMGLLIGAMSLSNEREQGSLAFLMAQPVSPTEILLGKYLGAAIALIAAIFLGFGASGAVISFYAGSAQIGGFVILLLFTGLLGLSFLSLGFLLSVFSTRSATATGLVFFVWFFFVFLSDLGIIGAVLNIRFAPDELFWLSVSNPLQSFKLAVIGALQKSLEAFGMAGQYATDAFGNAYIFVMAALIIFWILTPLGISLWRFNTKCAD